MNKIGNLQSMNNNRDRVINGDKNSNIQKKSNKKIDVENRTDKFIIGTKIIKKLNGVPYEGKVIGYNKSKYKIRYTDNDEEELGHQTVQSSLKNLIRTSRQKRRKRQIETLVQSNLRREQIPAKDSELFVHSYPTRIITNCCIITYQNTGQ